MPLTILNVAYSAAPVRSDSVGGAEQVLRALDEALVAAGCRSLVVACAGSEAAGTLIETLPIPPVLDDAARRELVVAHAAAISSACAVWDVDVIHLHGIDCLSYFPQTHVPTLVTLHLPPEWYPRELFQPRRPNVHFVCVSESQRRSAANMTDNAPIIENGVDLTRYRPVADHEDYLLAIGRICREKGFHLALQAAQQADQPLILAGQVFPYPAHQEYFDTQIAPLLDDRRRFIGPIGGKEKTRMISHARCVLAPSLVAETSSLVAMEANACGTPVIAFPAGALAEIIEPGRNGFLVNCVDEMIEALGRIAEIDRKECRRAAECRFDQNRTVHNYLALYNTIAAPHPHALRGSV